MYPKRIDNLGNEIALLNNITQENFSQKFNGDYQYNFTCVEEQFKTDNFDTDEQISIDVDGNTQLFDVVYIDYEEDSNGKADYNITTEHVSYRLIEKLDNYSKSGTINDIANDILSGTDFTFTSNTDVTVYLLVANQTASKLNLLRELASLTNNVLKFDSFNVSLETEPVYDGKAISTGKNVTVLKHVKDKRNNSEYYVLNVANLYNSERKSPFLENYSVNDKIELNRGSIFTITEVTKNIIKDTISTITVSNDSSKNLSISDSISSVYSQSVKKDENIYGMKINSTIGQVIERYDKFAKYQVNADVLRFQVGDGVGGYTDAIYFDIINKIYKLVGDTTFEGKVEVTNGTVTVKINPSGTTVFEIKDGSNVLYSVDSSGNSVYAGDIQTTKNIRVGENLYIGESGDVGTRILTFFAGGTDAVDLVASSGDLTIRASDGQIDTECDFLVLIGHDDVLVESDGGDVTISAGSAGAGDVKLNGDNFKVNGSTGINTTIVTATNTYTVSDGIITSVV